MSTADSQFFSSPLIVEQPSSESASARASSVPAVTADLEVLAMTQAVSRGDESAFCQIHDRYAPRLLRLLFAFSRGSDDLAEEALQITMVKAATKLPLLKTERQLWSWLATVARNALIDLVRKQHRSQATDPEKLRSIIEAASAAEPDSDNLLYRFLEESLSELDAASRLLIDAVYVERDSQTDIAAQEGTSARAIEGKLARLRKKLRASLVRKLKAEENNETKP